MSEPMRPADPASVGGFRLLRRLGAGGMGVVYLGRSGAGALAAVKVIRAESAADDEFRARFAREAQLAARVESPWVVPVLGADADAPEPWLATAFVPGPSLGEAVAEHGPLPGSAVRVLGALLGEALGAVHGAGLVHRDVKPGNVLLALNGPRLIDFGIARAADDTALTASGLVIGTPGFLSPEQARGDQAGPAGDVFALGCVLAYAATGRPPFGTGTPDALLYRTVHDEPDLDGVAGELREVLDACLAKDPQDRPAPEELRRLSEDATEDAVPEGATASPSAWLPDPVARTVAARAAESLALPAVEPTVVDEPGDAASAARRPLTSRRRLLAVGGALLLASGGSGAALWAAGRDDPGAKPVPAAEPTYVLGVQVTRGGADAALARACERAARLAAAEHNADPRRAYSVRVRVLDDGGTVDRATSVAHEFAADRDVFAVLGPTGEVTLRAASRVYAAAKLTHVSSTTGQNDYYVWSPDVTFQTGAPHQAEGTAIALSALVTGRMGRAGIVIDRSGGSAMHDQGGVLVTQWRDTFGGEVVPRVVAEGTGDGAAAVRDLLSRDLDAFVYLGPLEATADAARQLARAGFTGRRWMSHLLYGSDFPRLAGAAGEGWYAVTPAVDPAQLTTGEAGRLTAAWRKEYGSTPEPYATEAYDSTRMLLQEFARTVPSGGGRPARPALAQRLAKATYHGVARTYTFNDYHQYAITNETLGGETYVHQVRDGRFRQIGPIVPKQGSQ
ncbi:bifunctional serine/threonine-protein kinase/ABC transporter substrate-binding protein [Actinacidiphila glaucinigra]|uniref:Serine/threonine protein kinase /amino acid/amide ABC transporter substrate-binding protein, HAAT family n=1 Tax=Actinacidiphila glaucinigra TaxID=235986 RepID=A0A239MYZ7_9ACTN|nr:bifunctional serine/threonine-protein kinase/ABC transporter substrate-binding protein [Actinacidiphila glaucinigra]SNT47855.1 serine/threonine protein kinase /amino acid/amide ABC transporter substrate-binding protein, HAAT family [Actinacidiphila glaucinigra]